MKLKQRVNTQQNYAYKKQVMSMFSPPDCATYRLELRRLKGGGRSLSLLIFVFNISEN